VYDTDKIENLAAVLVDLIGFFASPRRVERLLREADVDLDRALFPILVSLAARGPMSVAVLSDHIGRDHTTISRQLSKLERLRLIARGAAGSDRRVRTVTLTAEGRAIAGAVTAARQRLLAGALAAWSDDDLAALTRLNRRFVDTLANA